METANLDEGTLTSYLSDIMANADGVSVLIKDSPGGSWRISRKLGEVHVALLHKHLWGAQVSYTLQGRKWVDTLVVDQGTTRMIRVQERD